MATFGDKICKS